MLAPKGRKLEGNITMYFPTAMASTHCAVFE